MLNRGSSTSGATTSLRVFRAHMTRDATTNELDVRGVISRECYLEYLTSKHMQESDESAKKFHRNLNNHITGVDGRNPFDPEEEAALLALLRLKQPWPCFPKHLNGFVKGYRSRGFHEKQRMATGALTPAPARAPSMQQQSSQPMVERIIQMLNSSDASYLRKLGRDVQRNFASPELGLEDWKTVLQIIRYTVIAKAQAPPSRGTWGGGEEEEEEQSKALAASALCAQFSLGASTVVTVLDLSAKDYTKRMLAQNEYCKHVFGQLVGSASARAVDGQDLFAVIVAVVAAHLRPGVCFPVKRQRHTCRNGETKLIDLEYYCDPNSLLLVIFGQVNSDPLFLVPPPPLRSAAQ